MNAHTAIDAKYERLCGYIRNCATCQVIDMESLHARVKLTLRRYPHYAEVNGQLVPLPGLYLLYLPHSYERHNTTPEAIDVRYVGAQCGRCLDRQVPLR